MSRTSTRVGLEKAAIAKGAKYFAVLTTPMATRPPVMPAHHVQLGRAVGDGGLDAVVEREHLAPGIGRTMPSPGPLQTAAGRQRLEVADLQRHCGLGEIEPLGSLGDAPVRATAARARS